MREALKGFSFDQMFKTTSTIKGIYVSLKPTCCCFE